MDRSLSSQAEASPETAAFPYGPVLTVALGHFIHDTFTAFLPPLLPWIIPRLGLTLAAAGSLTLFVQLPSLINPFIGYLADRVRLRWLIILAPGLTATLMTLVGLPESYVLLAAILTLTGLSVAAFHAPAPALVATLAPRRTGLGMSLFMAAGELGRTLGPLLAVAAVGWWGLGGLPRLAVVGWVTSAVLAWRFARWAEPRPRPTPLREALPRMARMLAVLAILILGRAALVGSLGTFLPTFLVRMGWSEAAAGRTFALYEFAGVAGALVLGSRSDRLGRERTLALAQGLGALLTLALVLTPGAARVAILPLLGFTLLAVQPIFLALVQDHFPDFRATANGVYLMLSFLIRPLATTAVGALGDAFGLAAAFGVAAAVALLSLPALKALPARGEG